MKRTCKTCPATLNPHDVSVGCKRCEACRAKRPGRTYPKRVQTERLKAQSKGTHQMGQKITVRSRKAATKVYTESWWARPDLHADRAKFMARAVQEMVVPNSTFALATSASGDCV